MESPPSPVTSGSHKVAEEGILAVLHLFKQHVDNCPARNLAFLHSLLFASEIRQWLLERTLGILSFRSFCAAGIFSLVSIRWPLFGRVHSIPTIPERELVDQCLAVYSTTLFQSVFPVVDPVNFAPLVAQFYATPLGARPSTIACVYMFTAFVARHAALRSPTTGLYAQRVLALVPDMLLEGPSVQGVEALTMLSLFTVTYGQMQLAGYALSLAVPMLYALGGNRSIGRIDGFNHPHLRHLFWLLYSLDKEISMRTLRPPLIKDEDCDLDLPAGYPRESPDLNLHSRQPGPVFLFPSDLHLATIKSRIYHHLCSRHAVSLLEAEQLKQIRSFDEELNTWKALHLREEAPAHLDASSSPEHAARALRALIPRLEYYNCLVRVHQAGLRCHRRQRGHSEALRLSEEIVLESCRSTLIYIRTVRSLLSSHTFWAFAMSALPAIITLAGSMLEYPHSQHHLSRRDLVLIQEICATFTSIAHADSTPEGLPPLIVSMFLGKLMQLISPQRSTCSSSSMAAVGESQGNGQ
ncbi:hypothetical protein BJX66DRAFT_341130 [Aspergillus keveii]|uniref:Xylanolytic transcriptional activator regulatory domain-containing protein n=1 Tax=Aspergillus keveii TaxID=714993 RepID=A0ABR4FW40_9EURO